MNDNFEVDNNDDKMDIFTENDELNFYTMVAILVAIIISAIFLCIYKL